jgi:hypothetical protein
MDGEWTQLLNEDVIVLQIQFINSVLKGEMQHYVIARNCHALVMVYRCYHCYKGPVGVLKSYVFYLSV